MLDLDVETGSSAFSLSRQHCNDSHRTARGRHVVNEKTNQVNYHLRNVWEGCSILAIVASQTTTIKSDKNVTISPTKSLCRSGTHGIDAVSRPNDKVPRCG